MTEQPTRDQEARGWLTPGVGSVAAASFFSDAGHEMATSLLPGFVTRSGHAAPGARHSPPDRTAGMPH